VPFYIRKSVSVGPFRFNFSKSGIGLSAGVKGFRIGTGPHGNYVHMGRNGIYYRASLNGARRPPSTQAKVTYSLPSESLVDVETGQILGMADTNANGVLDEINEALTSFPVWPFLLVPGLIGSIFLYSELYFLSAGVLAFLVVVASLIALYLDGIRRSVVLMYDMDSESVDFFEKFVSSFGC
jgi:hypothetical protein